jgi:hypothetical protein
MFKIWHLTPLQTFKLLQFDHSNFFFLQNAPIPSLKNFNFFFKKKLRGDQPPLTDHPLIFNFFFLKKKKIMGAFWKKKIEWLNYNNLEV